MIVYVKMKMRVEPLGLCACEKRYFTFILFIHVMRSTRPSNMTPPVNAINELSNSRIFQKAQRTPAHKNRNRMT